MMRRRVAFLALIFAIGALVVPTAGASSGWSIQASPNATGAVPSHLRGVSCVAVDTCVAVGDRSASTGARTFVERWNGTAWSIQSSPNAAATGNDILKAVSCVNANACVAVGTADDRALVERWNGAAWSVQPSPNAPADAPIVLSGVSCTSAMFCIAVGTISGVNTGPKTLVERWNGTTWSRQSTPDRLDADRSGLQGVSCTSATACMAVGTDTGPSGDRTLLERWNGVAWKLQASPTPSAAGQLRSVSCATAASCAAVGANVDGSILNERWNGTKWSVSASPNAPDGAQLFGVACDAASSCTAVGSSVFHPGTLTFVEHWNGTKWIIEPSPNPIGGFEELDGVACVEPATCTAVGDAFIQSTNLTLVERGIGSSWSAQASPDGHGALNSDLMGVECVNASNCTAVGSGGDKPLVTHWNGSAWVTQPTPKKVIGWLAAIACGAPASCTAVGSSGSKAVIEHWNGTSWQRQTAPVDGSLLSISCNGARCIAVGAAGDDSLILRGYGAKWTRQTSPNRDGMQNELAGVWCTSPKSCTAVGHSRSLDTGHDETLVEYWDGVSWTIQDSPNRPDAIEQSSLRGVQCLSATNCFAVGYDDSDDSASMTLIEHWNGTAWSIQPTPLRPNEGKAFAAVSCTTATNCTAVGGGGVAGTLIEHWDGAAWKMQPSPNPAHFDYDGLDAIACTSATACTATGSSTLDNDYTYASSTLVVHHP